MNTLSHMTLWWRGLLRSCGKLKSLYLHYHSADGHQIGQAGDFLWGFSTHDATPAFRDGILRDHVTNHNPLYLHYHNIYGHKIWQDDNLHRVTSTIKSHDHIITWSCKIMWQAKIIIYPLIQCLWPSVLAELQWRDIQWGIPFHEVTRSLNQVVFQGHVVGNKAKGRISKRGFQENKARQIFRIKPTFFTPLAIFVSMCKPRSIHVISIRSISYFHLYFHYDESYNLRMLLSICFLFCQFQPNFSCLKRCCL